MSIEIIYNKQFIKVQDKYIPIFQHGSNNCQQLNYATGRYTSEKNWNLTRWMKHNRTEFMFQSEDLFNRITQEQLREIEQHNNRGQYSWEKDEEYKNKDTYTLDSYVYSGTAYKSKNKCLKYNQLINLYKNGIKEALTIQELTEQGNRITASVTIYNTEKETEYQSFEIKTEQDLFDFINLCNKVEIEKKEKESIYYNIGFKYDNIRKNKTTRMLREQKTIDNYYVIKRKNNYSWESTYLHKVRGNRVWYASYKGGAKKFTKEKDCIKMLDTLNKYFDTDKRGWVMEKIEQQTTIMIKKKITV